MGNRLLFIVFFIVFDRNYCPWIFHTRKTYWININLAIYFVTKRGISTREVFFVYSVVIGVWGIIL